MTNARNRRTSRGSTGRPGSRGRGEHGFTLIEIMISMAILAVISVLATSTMRAGITDREAVDEEMASSSQVEDAMRIMRNDINAAYHYRDIFITMENNAIKPDKQTPAPGQQAPNPVAAQPPLGADPAATQPQQPQQPGQEPAPTPRPTPIDLTGFIGDSESLYFTTLSNQRTIQDSPVSDQAKVGYYVKSCKARSGNKVIDTKCLMRSFSPYLDDHPETPGDETVLLSHIDQFKLRYLGPGRETTTDLEYVDTWKTGVNGDAITKANFPYAVEITLSVEDKNDKKFKRATASALVPIRFPNNPPKNKDGTPGNGDPTQAATDATQGAGAPGTSQSGGPPVNNGSFNPSMNPGLGK